MLPFRWFGTDCEKPTFAELQDPTTRSSFSPIGSHLEIPCMTLSTVVANSPMIENTRIHQWSTVLFPVYTRKKTDDMLISTLIGNLAVSRFANDIGLRPNCQRTVERHVRIFFGFETYVREPGSCDTGPVPETVFQIPLSIV